MAHSVPFMGAEVMWYELHAMVLGSYFRWGVKEVYELPISARMRYVAAVAALREKEKEK